MHFQKLDADKFLNAYGVDLQVLYPWEGVVTPPFGAAWAILGPGNSTKLHQHQELETFFIARGQGEMTIADETVTVGPGSVVFQQPFHQHTLTNTSADEDLMFLTVWWEDRSEWPAEGETPTEKEAARSQQRRVMVTAAPPTPNGDLHLGHLAGPYLSADYYTRYLRARGREGFYACGTDDNCMYVERMGESRGMTGAEATVHFTTRIEETLEKAGIALHTWMHPGRSPHFKPLVMDLFHQLHSQGKLEAREAPAPFCADCDRYLFEADIAGRCPHCDEKLTGNTCEACGRVNDCIDLQDAACTACGASATTRPFTRLVFPLSRYAEPLARYLGKVRMNTHLRSFCERYLADGLPDVAVSHVSTWGIPVPLDDPALEGQRLYVWFEMAARYFAYAQHLNDAAGVAQDYGRFWRDDDAEIVQFFGFDNSFYYTLMLPGLYMAFDEELRLPAAFVCNEFYQLDGEKFSTSRGHSILGRVLCDAAPRDAVRFFLAYSCPEREETNFTITDFEETVERELVDSWQVWLRRLHDKMMAEFDGKVPATGDWTAEQLHFFRRIKQLIAAAAEAYEPATFSPQRATRILCELVRSARRFGKEEDHWRGVPDREQERRTAVALELVAAKTLAVVASPIMPDFASRLWRDLGYENAGDQGTWEETPEWVPAGQEIGDLGIDLFSSVRRCMAVPAAVPAQR